MNVAVIVGAGVVLICGLAVLVGKAIAQSTPDYELEAALRAKGLRLKQQARDPYDEGLALRAKVRSEDHAHALRKLQGQLAKPITPKSPPAKVTAIRPRQQRS